MEGHLIQRGKSKTWYLVFDVGAPGPKRKQRWVSLKTKSKTEAQKKKRDVLRDYENPQVVAQKPKPDTLTVGQLFDKWLGRRESTLAAKTHEWYEALTRNHARPVLGEMLVSTVTPENIDDVYHAMRTAGLSDRTLLHVHRTLHTAFGFAVRYLRIVNENIVDRVTAPKPKSRQNDTLSEEQVRTVIEAAKGSRLETPVLLSALTGLRRGECLALRWKNVDFEREQIIVTEALEQTRNFGVRFKEPKSRSSRRVLPIPSELVAALHEHKASQDEERAEALAWFENDLVFSNPDGMPWPPDTFTKQFAEMCRFVGIQNFRLHDLRHAFASITLKNGVSVKEVSTLLGHSSATLTLSTYARSMEGQGRLAVSGLAKSLLSPARG